MTNDRKDTVCRLVLRHLGLRHSFVIRHSCFVIHRLVKLGRDIE
jgi:hypothetical protein